MLRAVAAAIIAVAVGVDGPRAQSSGTNPDISVIGQFIACPQGADDCAYTEADGDLELQEIEAALQGYLNPYVRGDVFVGYHGGDVEVEEAYATFVRGLGPVQLKVGKYRLGWGSINPLHPHAYSWVFQPLVEERLFGPEGLNQIAVGANAAFPIGERGELTFAGDLLRGDIAEGEHSHGGDASQDDHVAGTICVGPGCDDGICQPGDVDCALVFYEPPAEVVTGEGPKLGYRLGVSYFNEIRPSHSIRVGANGLWGTIDPGLDRKVTWLGADAKYRWRPDKYRSLNVIGAWMRSKADLEADVPVSSVCLGPDCVGDVCPDGGVCTVIDEVAHVRGGTISTSGAYLLADWQFAQRWNAGVKLDRCEGLESDDSIERAELFLNWRLMEESTLFRLLFRREDGDLYDSPHNTTALQMVFSLGPHRPHAF